MKIEIEIPKAFEKHFNLDRFKDSFDRFLKEYNSELLRDVRQGIVVAEDMCEWTKIDEEGYKNCECNYDETIPDFFKYCPYCGKKILCKE